MLYETEQAAEQANQHGRAELVDQVVRDTERRWGTKLSAKLAIHFGQDPQCDPFPGLAWRMTERGRGAIQVEYGTSNVVWEKGRVELATNIGGYAVASFGDPDDKYSSFHLTTGTGSSNGFRDLADFGRIISKNPKMYLWDDVRLSS